MAQFACDSNSHPITPTFQDRRSLSILWCGSIWSTWQWENRTHSDPQTTHMMRGFSYFIGYVQSESMYSIERKDENDRLLGCKRDYLGRRHLKNPIFKLPYLHSLWRTSFSLPPYHLKRRLPIFCLPLKTLVSPDLVSAAATARCLLFLALLMAAFRFPYWVIVSQFDIRMELELIDIGVCWLLLSNTLYDVAFEDGRNLICQGDFLRTSSMFSVLGRTQYIWLKI